MCLCACVSACEHVCVSIYAYVCVFCMCMCVHAFMHVCVFAYECVGDASISACFVCVNIYL